jgi:hypothetical protein
MRLGQSRPVRRAACQSTEDTGHRRRKCSVSRTPTTRSMHLQRPSAERQIYQSFRSAREGERSKAERPRQASSHAWRRRGEAAVIAQPRRRNAERVRHDVAPFFAGLCATRSAATQSQHKVVAKDRVRPAAGTPGRIHERHATLRGAVRANLQFCALPRGGAGTMVIPPMSGWRVVRGSHRPTLGILPHSNEANQA